MKTTQNNDTIIGLCLVGCAVVGIPFVVYVGSEFSSASRERASSANTTAAVSADIIPRIRKTIVLSDGSKISAYKEHTTDKWWGVEGYPHNVLLDEAGLNIINGGPLRARLWNEWYQNGQLTKKEFFTGTTAHFENGVVYTTDGPITNSIGDAKLWWKDGNVVKIEWSFIENVYKVYFDGNKCQIYNGKDLFSALGVKKKSDKFNWVTFKMGSVYAGGFFYHKHVVGMFFREDKEVIIKISDERINYVFTFEASSQGVLDYTFAKSACDQHGKCRMVD